MKKISDIAKDNGSKFVVGVNLISLGLLKPPGAYGADIAVGKRQPFGNPTSLGGLMLGIFACKEDRKYIHQLPGHLSGMAETKEENTRGFVIALQTREQYYCRKWTTSNICTNNSLYALAAAIYISSLGSEGLKKVAKNCADNAKNAIQTLEEIEGIEVPIFDEHHFNEFTRQF